MALTAQTNWGEEDMKIVKTKYHGEIDFEKYAKEDEIEIYVSIKQKKLLKNQRKFIL